jgi:hypothetical protein
VSVATRGAKDVEGFKLCTMFIYDLTPESLSYTCYRAYGDPAQLPVVALELGAWNAQDQVATLLPRAPLDNSR